MKIKLSKDRFAIVDKDDLEKIKTRKWYASKGRTTYYAITSVRGKTVYMHRMIMNAKNGRYVDHVNKNGLDNRKSNLRLVSNAQNCRNNDKHLRRRIKLKGVILHETNGKYARKKQWQSRIWVNGKSISLGYFFTPEEAAREYDKAALRLFNGDITMNYAKPKLNGFKE